MYFQYTPMDLWLFPVRKQMKVVPTSTKILNATTEPYKITGFTDRSRFRFTDPEHFASLIS